MKTIAEQTGAKLRLRGCGSGLLEGANKQESIDPLMICISAPDVASYQRAKELVKDLLEDIYKEYHHHYKEIEQAVPKKTFQSARGLLSRFSIGDRETGAR